MNYEMSCGSILYKKEEGTTKYLIIKDRNDNYSFPKGHMEDEEKPKETAKREIKEEVGLDVEIDDIFDYSYSYMLNDDTKKIVELFVSEFNKAPYINDSEVKEIFILPYEDAINLLTYKETKEALFEANLYISNVSNVCCMFKKIDPKDANRVAIDSLRVVEEYGSSLRVHTCDSGERWLSKCKECGCYVMVQQSETWYTDHDYYDYVPVLSLEHGRYVNEKYDGYGIESKYPYKKLFINDGEPSWH